MGTESSFTRLRALWSSSHSPDVRAARLVADIAAVDLSEDPSEQG